jgi:hypothetical protein
MRRAERLPLALNMQDVAEFYLMAQLICTLLLFSKTGPVKKMAFSCGLCAPRSFSICIIFYHRSSFFVSM